MTPIYIKTFDSPLLAELLRLTQKEWMKLKCRIHKNQIQQMTKINNIQL